MSKTIIFCADGTWNGPGEPDDDNAAAPTTNVYKLFTNLDGKDSPGPLLLAKEQERMLQTSAGEVAQAAKYIHGVGDSNNFLVKAMGGTIGAGLIVRIVRGYTFISRNYTDGDRIIIIGFSRGAYTARALAGLIAAQGLLDVTRLNLADKISAYRLGSAVWSAYLPATRAKNPDWLGRFEEFVLDLPGFLSKPPPQNATIAAPIEAIAVWDTVGALGIPEFTMRLARIDAFQFADTKLSPVVRRGIHAVSVDEQRADFTPTLWEQDTRILQALFPGAHSDVGGGYPTTDNESGISDSSLSWMTKQLAPMGVHFSASPTYTASPNPGGTAHQPWNRAPWTFLARKSRQFPPGLCVTQCLKERMAAGPVLAAPNTEPVAYSPENIADYLVGNDAKTSTASLQTETFQ